MSERFSNRARETPAPCVSSFGDCRVPQACLTETLEFSHDRWMCSNHFEQTGSQVRLSSVSASLAIPMGIADGMTPPLLVAIAITPLWHVDATEGGHPICNIASYEIASVLQGLLRLLRRTKPDPVDNCSFHNADNSRFLPILSGAWNSPIKASWSQSI